MSDIPATRLTHLDERGEARMVDVSGKATTLREATAQAFVACSEPIMEALTSGATPKGDALAVARIAGIAAAKRCPELLPLAHPIRIDGVTLDVRIVADGVMVTATVRARDRTGVEMEALTAATVAGLALVDMVKGVDRGVSLERCLITRKSGGRSGTWVRPGTEAARG
jgi:GTP cyclohydrolase subunit MoaC